MSTINQLDEKFSPEQENYLLGFFAGVQQRQNSLYAGVNSEGKITADPAAGGANMAKEPEEELWFNTPVDELCKEEKFKREESPWAIWEKMIVNAEKGVYPKDGDIFRYKNHGLFYVAPAQDSLMVRVRIPGNCLSARQLQGLAEVSRDWGGGYADVTTRGNFQIREIEAGDALKVLMKLQSLGLITKGAGADNVRNITATPTTGFDPQELLDVRTHANALQYYILNQPDMFSLPRKFNVAFDSGGSVSVVSDTNDIAFQAVTVGPGKQVEPGIYFRIYLAGTTGHDDFAKDSGLLIKPQESIAVAGAMLKVFSEYGCRTNRSKARFKYLLDDWGLEKFLEEIEKHLAFPLCYLSAEDCLPRHKVIRGGHIGIFKQKQSHENYFGVALPVGRITSRQMEKLAKVAEQYGWGEIRPTVWQNLIIPGVSDNDTSKVSREIERMGLALKTTTVTAGLVACTGNKGCKFSATDTKGHGLEIAKHLNRKLHLETPINIHLTGCPHSCAQHKIADIGLLGAKVTNQAGEKVEGYHVLVGGGCDDGQGIGRQLFTGIPFPELPALLERMISRYQKLKQRGETFLDFVRRHEIDQLQELFSDAA